MPSGEDSYQEAAPSGEDSYCVERFTVAGQCIGVAGWIWFQGRRIRALSLELDGIGSYPMRLPKLPSPEVEARYGAEAQACRFNEQIIIDRDFSHGTGVDQQAVNTASLLISFEGGGGHRIEGLTTPRPQESPGPVFGQFLAMVAEMERGRVLEIGSRARSGNVHRNLVPDRLEYVGLDVMAGPNVDVVGDAHGLSGLFPAAHFNAVFAISVLEHVLMPWKLVIELNRVLAPGAIGFFGTHQGWPLHDAPWDFWRFSDQAWVSLFNAATGFEIVEARMGERATVVAERWRPVVDFGILPTYLSSVVLFRKVADTRLEWPVELSAITESTYPDDSG